MNPDIAHSTEDLWVFGYGSLIWRPGFEFVEKAPARLIGAHRALCVFSHVHRGTPERPGLVLGLDFGGACRGVAYRVPGKRRGETVAYLRAREQVTASTAGPCARHPGEPQRRVDALAHMIDRGHVQYAGRLDLDAAALVRQGHAVRPEPGICARPCMRWNARALTAISWRSDCAERMREWRRAHDGRARKMLIAPRPRGKMVPSPCHENRMPFQPHMKNRPPTGAAIHARHGGRS